MAYSCVSSEHYATTLNSHLILRNGQQVMCYYGQSYTVMGRPLYSATAVSSFFLFFLTYSQQSQFGCLPYYHTWCGLSANLECKSEMCCTWLAENMAHKNSPFVHYHAILSGYIFTTKACIDIWKKNMLNSNMSSTYAHNMVNFRPLTAEIGWRVWGTPVNFNESWLHYFHDFINSIQQRAPCTFGWVAIGLGIGSHSSRLSSCQFWAF